jgi:hypothetical protein
MTKEGKDNNVRIRIIITSIEYKFSDQKQKVLNLLDSTDWSTSIREFKLVNYLCEMILKVNPS